MAQESTHHTVGGSQIAPVDGVADSKHSVLRRFTQVYSSNEPAKVGGFLISFCVDDVAVVGAVVYCHRGDVAFCDAPKEPAKEDRGIGRECTDACVIGAVSDGSNEHAICRNLADHAARVHHVPSIHSDVPAACEVVDSQSDKEIVSDTSNHPANGGTIEVAGEQDAAVAARDSDLCR